MTDRVKGITIVLENDIREDDVESLIEAVRHFRGVLTAVPIVALAGNEIERIRAYADIRAQLFKFAEGIGTP